MKKWYLEEMENYDCSIELQGEYKIEEDEKGYYTTDEETAKWWQETYNKLELINTDKIDFNDYNDLYIRDWEIRDKIKEAKEELKNEELEEKITEIIEEVIFPEFTKEEREKMQYNYMQDKFLNYFLEKQENGTWKEFNENN